MENLIQLKTADPFNPDWANDAKAEVRKQALMHPDVPVAILEQLKKDKNKEIRLLAELILIGLLKSDSPEKRSERISTLLEKVLALSADFKEQLSGMIKCPAEILEALSKERDKWTYASALARNPSTPEGVLIKLGKLSRSSDYPMDVIKEVCENPSATPVVFKALLQSKSAKIRVADYPQHPKNF